MRSEQARSTGAAPAQRKNGGREVGGAPLRVRRTGGAKWLRSLLRKPGKAPGDIQ